MNEEVRALTCEADLEEYLYVWQVLELPVAIPGGVDEYSAHLTTFVELSRYSPEVAAGTLRLDNTDRASR